MTSRAMGVWIIRAPVTFLPVVVGMVAVGLTAGCGGNGGGGSAAPIIVASSTVTAPTTRTPTRTPTLVFTASPTSTRTVTSLVVTATPTAQATTPPTATQTPTVESPSATATPTTPTLQSTSTPTSTPLIGPIVSAFGLADAAGAIDSNVTTDGQGRSVFTRRLGEAFIVYVEGRVGPSRRAIGTARFNHRPGDPARQPDLQIVSSHDLGRPSAAVCDGWFPVRGGVPAVEPPDFSPVTAVSDALNDAGCRFKAFLATDFPCTQDSRGGYVFANASSTTQFCTLVDEALTFPLGETVLTARLRDVAGNAGPAVQIVVRVTGGQ